MASIYVVPPPIYTSLCRLYLSYNHLFADKPLRDKTLSRARARRGGTTAIFCANFGGLNSRVDIEDLISYLNGEPV